MRKILQVFIALLRSYTPVSDFILKTPISDTGKILVAITFLICCQNARAQDFITVWRTNSPNEVITLPNPGIPADYNFTVDWGDGAVENLTTPLATHTYVTPGDHQVSISGLFERFNFDLVPNSVSNILSVEAWGNLSVVELNFKDAVNLQINATDAPDLTRVTSFENIFNNATSLNADLSGWDTSTITNMSNAFLNASSFNGNISTWITTQVTDMSGMFDNASAFNSDISGWDVSNVRFMNRMFTGATSFNIDISLWITSSVENMGSMFSNATLFNQNIGGWDTINVEDMSFMFNQATNFNQNLNLWDTINVEDMSFMFASAINFNSDISSWDTSKVIDMSSMFSGATNFNNNISGWNTVALEFMDFIFSDAVSFDHSLGDWNVENVTSIFNGLANSGISTSNYDDTLIKWSSQNLRNNVFFGVQTLTYCLGGEARQSIINTFGWTFTGDTLNCSSILDYSIIVNSNGVEGINDIIYEISIDGGFTNTTGLDITGTLSLTGTATSGLDYTNITGFTIVQGSNSVLVTIPVLDDTEVEPTESVVATISSPSIGSINTANAIATANILDDDGATLEYSIVKASNGDGIENDRDIIFVVTITRGLANSNTTGSDITGILTLAGTATTGADYTNVTTFTIPNGNASALVVIPVLDDTVIELTETVVATISAPSIGSIDNATATANIFDDDGLFSITNPVDGVEGSSDITYTVSIDGGVSNTTGSNITGTLSLSGTATSGVDYTNVATFTIPDGSNNTVITVPIVDDVEVEPIESVIATISSPSVGSINTANATATANILDNDGANLQYSITSSTDGEEGVSDITYTISIDGGINNTTGAAITGNVILTGTAFSGLDYNNITSFTIATGTNNVVVTVPVIDDTEVEPIESVIATISSPSVGSINTANATATANILDNDGTNLQYSITSSTDGEEGVSDITYTISIDGGINNTTGAAITGNVILTGTAFSGLDYNNITSFTIATGTNNVVVTVPVIDDTEVEPIESVIATISSPSAGSINTANATATANILDNDGTNLQYSITSSTDGEEGVSDITYTISIDGGINNTTGAAITGNVILTGTAFSGLDYTNVTSFTIVQGVSSVVITVPVIDDTEVEPTETVVATISSPNIGSVNVSNNSAISNIIDNDVLNPNLALSKIGEYIDANNDGRLNIGDQIAYTFTVENNGNEVITDITLSDPMPGVILQGGPINLAPGEIDNFSFTGIYNLTEDDLLRGSVVNQAFATGRNPDGLEIIDFSDDPNDNTNEDDDSDGDGEDPTVTRLIPDDEFIIYQVITPNNDGLNDEFRILGLRKYPENTLVVYNRWGAEVFKARGYEQKEVSLFNGYWEARSETLPTGTYYYVLEYKNDLQEVNRNSGYLYIN